ncbi:hypothetical protein PM082_021776 [Marasmius tenuissimus]|nr:hypothetical protein PM082_021776 [Marasmius tenuissimus]
MQGMLESSFGQHGDQDGSFDGSRPPTHPDERFRRSNCVPSDAERAQLTAMLEKEPHVDENYGREIVSLQERLVKPEAGKQATTTIITYCRSALSAYRKLPAEIWELIFKIYCLKLHEFTFHVNFEARLESYQRPRTKVILETPTITLSQVCTDWRQIVQSRPALWSSICVEFNHLPFDVSAPLSTHLENCNGRLSVIRSIGCHPVVLSPYLQRMDNAWRILSKHFVHCRDLVTDFSHFTIPRKLDLFFPNLKIYKEETILDYPPQGGARSLLDALRDGAPKLTKASVRDLHPCFPYTRLSFLEITNFSDLQNMKALFRLLPICPRLESLSLLGMDNYDIDLFTREIKVPNLRRLSIFEHTCSSHPEEDILDTVLLSLKLPGLKAFELHCEEWPNSLDVSVNYFTSSLETLKVHIGNLQ